jgi:hypothetical protein
VDAAWIISGFSLDHIWIQLGSNIDPGQIEYTASKDQTRSTLDKKVLAWIQLGPSPICFGLKMDQAQTKQDQARIKTESGLDQVSIILL